MKTNFRISLIAISLLLLLYSVSTAVTTYTDSVKSKDEVMIYYDIHNPGHQPLIFIHGWCSKGSFWQKQAEYFSKDFTVITVDLAGHGRSERRPAGCSHHFVDWVPQVLEAANVLSLDRFALLGHSMGAGISSLLAGTEPERIERAVLIEGLGPLVERAAREGATLVGLPENFGFLRITVERPLRLRWEITDESADALLAARGG